MWDLKNLLKTDLQECSRLYHTVGNNREIILILGFEIRK